jgi:Tfp pilus assembly protein PilF
MKLGSICKRIIYFSIYQYQKLNRHQVIKLLFPLTLVICLLFGQVVTAQTPNTNALVERGIKDYNAGNFANAIKNWQEALNQYKNNLSARAVVY